MFECIKRKVEDFSFIYKGRYYHFPKKSGEFFIQFKIMNGVLIITNYIQNEK